MITSLISKGILAAIFLNGSIVLSTDTEKDPLPMQLEEGIQLDLEDKKAKIPSIMVIDKNLGIKAEFYGEIEKIKSDFKSIFDQTELILEHNNQRIYLITK